MADDDLDTLNSPQQDYLDQSEAGGRAGGLRTSSVATPPAQTQTPAQPATRARTGAKPNANYLDDAPVFVAPQQQPAPAASQGSLRDFGRQVWASGLEMGQGVLGTASATARALGSDPTTVQWIEQQRAALEQHIQATVADMAPQRQQAMHASIFGGQDENGEHVPTPGEVGWGNYLSSTVASLVPQAALAMLPGGLVGRAISAIGFGSIDAGEAYNKLVDEVDKAKPDELMTSPVYAHLVQSGVSDIDARKQLVAGVAPSLLAERFAIGTAAGAGVGGLLTHGAAGAAGRSLFKRAAIGGAEGAATMGGQGAGDEAAQQQAQMGIGTRQEFDPSRTAQAFASGALGGLVLGGAGGALHARQTEAKPLPSRNVDTIGSDQEAALNEALQPTNAVRNVMTSQPAGFGAPGVGDQGEMFQPFETSPTAPQPGPGLPPAATQGEMFPAQGAGVTQGQTEAFAPPQMGPVRPNPQAGLPDTAQQSDLFNAPAAQPPAAQKAVTASKSRSTGAQENTTVVTPAADAVAPRPGPAATLPPEGGAAPPSGAVSAPAPTHVDEAAAQAAEPTPAQAQAGNYQKGHTSIGGLDVTIETPKDGVRRGIGENGEPWEATMPAHYGYIKRTEGADGDHVDVTLGPQAHEAEQHPVFVVDQIDPKARTFDEHKGLVGFDTKEAALAAYDGSFSDGSGPTRRAAVTEMPFDKFKDWVTTGDTKKPLAWKPNKGDQLRAKRAAQKQMLAKPAEPMRGVVATVSDEGAAENAWVQAAIKGREDFTQRRQEMLRSSQSQGPVIALLSKTREAHPEWFMTDNELQATAKHLATLDDVTPADVLKAREAARNPDERLAGVSRSAARPKVSADVEDKMAERGGAIDADEAATALAESEGQPASSGSQIETAPEEALSDTTSKEREAQRLLDKVLDGDMTPAEAAREFGEQSTTGRKRGEGLATFRDFLTREAERAASPGEAERVIKKAAAAQKSEMRGSGEGANTKRGRTVTLRKELERVGPAYAAKVRELAQRLEDPVGEAADTAARKAALREQMQARVTRERGAPDRIEQDRQHIIRSALRREEYDEESSAPFEQFKQGLDDGLKGKPQAATGEDYTIGWQRGRNNQQARAAQASSRVLKRAVPDGSPTRSRYVRLMRDNRLNEFVSRDMMTSETHDVPYTLHDALRSIVNQAAVKTEMTPLHSLARRLLNITKDVPVVSPEFAREHDLANADDVAAMNQPNTQGLTTFDTVDGRLQPRSIVLNPHTDSAVATIVHEAMHTVTGDYIDRLERTDPTHRDLQALAAIREELRDLLPELEGYEHAHVQYALTDNHELHTMLMSDPIVQAVAASHIASADLRIKLSDLGFGPSGRTRSVWRAFTDWMRRSLGLTTPASVHDYTLLDHLLRPTQDITDRAVQQNARLLPADPELRERAAPSLQFSIDSAKGTGKKALDKIDPKGINDRGRKLWLQGATTDGIVDWYRGLFKPSDHLALDHNPLEAFRSAQEAIGRSSKEFHDQYADRVNDLATRYRGLGAEQDTLGQVMTDATLAEARLGTDDPRANRHLTSREQLAALDGLRDRYAKLSPEAQKLYGDMRNVYGEIYRDQRTAELRSIIRAVMPDATDDQVKTFETAGRGKQALQKFMDDPDNSDIAQSFGTDWAKNRALAKGIAKAHSHGFVQGDYFPLRRFGDYVVRYGSEENGDLGVEMFDKRAEAQGRRNELARQGADDLSQVLSRRDSKLTDILPHSPSVDELVNAMKSRDDLKGHADNVRDLLNSILLTHATHTEAARTRMRRRGVKGAAIDHARVLADTVVNQGARMGYLEHGSERLRALSDMQLVADDLGAHGGEGDQIKASAVIRELEQRIATGDNATGIVSDLARKANVFGYAQSLMSFSHMLTSTVEAHTNSAALLGARHGYGRASLALTKALAELSPKILTTGVKNSLSAVGGQLKAADWNMAHLARDRLVAHGADKESMGLLFKALEDAGLVDHTMTQEMRRIANPSGIARSTLGKAWQRFMDFNAAGAHAVDVMNKSAIAKAAYDLEFRRTSDQAKAIDFALSTARKAMPNYNLGNKSRIATNRGSFGAMGTPLMQFKNYGLHMYSMMANLAKASVTGASREERIEARKAFAGLLATHAMTAGVLTLIADPLRYIGGAYDYATGAQKPHDYENDVRGWISDTFGPELGEIIARGAPHAAGIDIHRRVGLANLLEVPELKSFDKKGVRDMLATAMLGAAGDDATTMAGGMEKMMQGDWLGGLQDAMPRVVRDVMKANSLATKGVTDTTGKTVLPPEKLGTGDILAQGLGFQPATVSEFREGRNAVLEARDEAKTEHTQLTQKWLSADPADRPDVMQEIRAWNASHPGQHITMDTLLRQQAARRKQANQPASSFGLKLPKGATASLSEAGRFANVGP